MAGSVVLSAIVFPTNQVIAFLSIIIIPFIIAFLMTKDIVDSLTIVWLNEIFFGVGGAWIKIGPIPGRGLLLLAAILVYISAANVKIKLNVNIRRTNYIVVFYGLLFPSFLFLYGTGVGGATVSNALSDVMRFGTVLMYFPILKLFRSNFDLSFGWLIGATSILALLFSTMAIAPDYIRSHLIVNWISNGDINTQFNRPGDEFIRTAMTPMILCFIGLFLGIMYALDSKKSFFTQISGVLLTSISVAPFIINFLRGPIFGIALSVITIVLLSSIQKVLWNRILRIMAISIFILLAGYWISVNYIPTSLTKWIIVGQDISDIVDPVRIEQTEKMLDAWYDEPILGKGVGVPLKDYSRDDSGLAFEVQYPMVLYRVGVFGFIIIMIPFMWMTIRTAHIWIKHKTYFENHIVKLQMAIAFATLSLLSASWANPYFATVMSPLFIVIFFALDKTTILFHKNLP